MRGSFLVILAICGISAASATHAADSRCSNGLGYQPSSCLEEVGVDRCRELLDDDPDNFRIRLAVCDGLIADGNIQAARGLMESARLVHERNRSMLSLIARAESNIDELASTPPPPGPDAGVLDDYTKLRCERYQNAQACRDLLAMDANNPIANNVLGDLAFDAGRVMEAINHYLVVARSTTDTPTRLQDALAQRETSLQPCFRRGNSTALEACNANLIPGYDDEAQIRMRMGDLHLLAGRYGTARQAYGHASTGTDGEQRAAFVNDLARCDGTTTSTCSRAIQTASANRTFSPLLAGLYERRCSAVLTDGSDEAVAEFCESALDKVTADAAANIRNALAARNEPEPDPPPPPVDPWQEVAQNCASSVTANGWDLQHGACQSLAGADVAPDLEAFRETVRSELDGLRLDLCRNALEADALERARSLCTDQSASSFLTDTRSTITALVTAAEQAAAAAAAAAAVPGNQPLFADEGNFVVTF